MKDIIIAVPKGRILEDLRPIISNLPISPVDEFYDEKSRKLIFDSKNGKVKYIKVRSFDVATFVSLGAAHIGICGLDVLLEFDYENIYTIKDLEIGKCRISLAAPKEYVDEEGFWESSHVHIATKYVNFTKNYFEKKGIQAECVKLNGSIELAPALGLCKRIVDLVSTGNTLRENGMVEGEQLAEITSKLIVNKFAYKAHKKDIMEIIDNINA